MGWGSHRTRSYVFVISTVKPTRCTIVSNLFYFGMTLYMFRRSFRPSSGVQDCTYSNQTDTAVCMLASRQQYMFDKCLLLYVQSWTPDDGRKDRPEHAECHSKIKSSWYIGASSWFYYRNNIKMHDPMKVKFIFLCIQKGLQTASCYRFTKRHDFYNIIFKMRLKLYI